MNKWIWTVVLFLGMTLAPVIGAQEERREERGPRGPAEPPNPEAVARQIEIANMQLAFKAKESELEFQNQMRLLEIKKKTMELEDDDKDEEGQQGKGAGCKFAGRGHGCPMMGHHPMMPFHLLMLAGCIVMHLLLTIWVYQDIRKRNTASGIWVVITLVGGFFGALLYALVRIGDGPTGKQ